MSRIKYDGVIEAVHYNPAGQVAWVRVYERRGSAFSDLVILSRAKLVERINYGKTFVIGRRVPYLAGAFETGKKLCLVPQDHHQWLTTENQPADKDNLVEAPVI
jgi:hypothetical protein